MTQEEVNEVMGKSLANYQLRQLAEDGGNIGSALTLIDRLESELLNAQEHAQNLEFLLNQKDEKISQLEPKAEAYDRLVSGGKKTLKERVRGGRMTRDIYYQGIDWEIEYDWEDDARTDMCMTAVKVQGSDVDLYDHLLESTLDGLYEELEESFK